MFQHNNLSLNCVLYIMEQEEVKLQDKVFVCQISNRHIEIQQCVFSSQEEASFHSQVLSFVNEEKSQYYNFGVYIFLSTDIEKIHYNKVYDSKICSPSINQAHTISVVVKNREDLKGILKDYKLLNKNIDSQKRIILKKQRHLTDLIAEFNKTKEYFDFLVSDDAKALCKKRKRKTQ